ncbi:MAG: DUF5329 domain-containing protein [Gammaproteobacteria bacterium]|nr:DUF5329 domain-containing protein [Gammaproteobacteria bacterium]
MKSIYQTVFTVLFLFYQIPSEAVPGSQSQAEIQHLLNFISSSDCSFTRNGSEHSALDARKHIEKKFNYVKSRVNSAEDFIQYAATRSSMSGEIYRVNCDGVSLTTGEWLLRELNRFREHGVPASLPPE